jgi:hypothetical protein
MRISKRQLRRIIKEEKAKLLEQPEQMSLNQSGVDLVRSMADQIEPMFEQFRKTAGQSTVATNDPLYNEIEQILLDLPGMIEEIADKMAQHGVEGVIR